MRHYPLLKPALRLNLPQHGYDDYPTYLCAYFVRNAYRHLWEAYQAEGLDLPSVTELAEWMYALAVHRDARRWVASVDLERMAKDAAAVALERYDPQYRARAAKGGRHGSRRPTFTYDQLEAVEGLSIPQQAEALGCSTATISRLRKRARIMADPDLRVLDQLDRQARTVGKLAPDTTFEDLMAEAGIGTKAETNNVGTNAKTVSAEGEPQDALGSITGMIPISIRTGKPMTPLELAIEETRQEDEARAWAECGDWMSAVGL